MEYEVTNEYRYNVNKHLELPHHEPLDVPRKIPKLLPKFHDTIKTLAGLAKNSKAIELKVHIDVIVRATSNADEQYGLLLFFYKCAGIKAPSHHNYRRLSTYELAKIRELYVAGKSVYAIAKALNRHVSTIYYALKRMGLKVDSKKTRKQ